MPAATQEWIKKAMRASRMSAAELARQTGVTRQAVSRWLHPDASRRTIPDEAHLRRIAEVTGVGYLEENNGEELEPPSAFAHSTKAVLLRDVMRIVRKGRPDLIENFSRAVEIPGARTAKVDYVSTHLVLNVIVGRPSGALWHLALLARTDQALRTRREAVLCHVGELVVPAGELRLLGLEPVPVSTADDVARLILESEKR
jgi:transcriptional regulator with XRE-family HTH domain